MKEIEEQEESIMSSKSKDSLSLDVPHTIFNNIKSINNNRDSLTGKDINTNMIDLIKELKKIKKEKTNEELYSIIPTLLKDINSNITKIIDNNNNTLAHLLLKEENNELLIIICNIYYILIINKNEFYDWFLKENNEDNKKLTILDMASIQSNKEMLEYLFEMISRTDGNKLKLNIKKNNFFHYSAKHNQYYSILFWYDKLQSYFPYLKLIDISNEYDITPLHYACFHGAIDCVDLLLDLQADINATDKDGKTPLTYAVNSGDIKIIKKLLIRGADKTIKDSDGKTPYFYAIKDKKFHLVPYLKNNTFCDKFKNFFCCKCQNDEIKQIKNNKKDFELLLYLLLYLLISIIFGIRLYNDNYLKNNYIYVSIGLICLGLNYIYILISLILIIYFQCIIKYNQHLSKNKKNFLTMFNNTNNICIKCIRIKKPNTIHCLVCNLCIDDWDHHCFWLNCCITQNNKKCFASFLIALFSFLFINIIFCLSFLFFYWTENSNDYINNIFNNENGKNEYLHILYISIFLFFLILFFFLFIYNFMLVMLCYPNNPKFINERKSRNTSFIKNKEEYHGDMIDNLIDRSDDE